MYVKEDEGGRNNGEFQIRLTGDELAFILGLAGVEELYEAHGSFEDAVRSIWQDLPEPVVWQVD